MSYLLAQLALDGPAEFFTLQTLYGLVLFTAIAKIIEIAGLEILDRMNAAHPERHPSVVEADRLRLATTSKAERLADIAARDAWARVK